MLQELYHAGDGSTVGRHEGVPCWDNHEISHVLGAQPRLLYSQRAIMLACGDTRQPSIAMHTREERCRVLLSCHQAWPAWEGLVRTSKQSWLPR